MSHVTEPDHCAQGETPEAAVARAIAVGGSGMTVLSPSRSRPIPRRGLSRIEAAMYLGISPTKFDALIADGRMPRPRMIDSRKVWDIVELDSAFDDLPHDAPSIVPANSWADRA
jgi:predicted DNA-binding transcriptional regulator AlpA